MFGAYMVFDIICGLMFWSHLQIFDNRIVGYLEEPSGKIDLIRDQGRFVAYRVLKETQRSRLVVFTHLREDK